MGTRWLVYSAPKNAHPAMRQQAAAEVVGIMLALGVVAFAAVAEDQAG